MRHTTTLVSCTLATTLAALVGTPARAQGPGATARPSAARAVPAETTVAAVKDQIGRAHV